MNSETKNIFQGAFNLPNSLSFLRLLLAIPFYFLLLHLQEGHNYRLMILGLILFASATDILDGFVARKTKQVTEFGKVIDPLADKVCMIVIVIQLYIQNEIPGIFFWIIILRDIIIFSGGIFVSRKIGKVLPSNMIGKITVITIGIFILVVIGGLTESNFFYRLFFYLSIIMSFASLVAYALRAYEFLKWKNNEHV